MFDGLLGTLFDQYNKMIAGALIALLKFLQQVLAIPLYPRNGSWQNFFYENALNLMYYMAFVVMIGMTIVGMFNHNRRLDWGRAIVSFVIIGLFGRGWFEICDQLQMLGNTAATSSAHLLPEAQGGASLLSHLVPPDPFTAAFGFSLAAMVGWGIGITAFLFPIIFIFVKFTGLIFFGLRVIGDRAQEAWDWAFGLLLVATVFGRPAMILCLDLGILSVKYMPGGATSYGAMLYTIASEGLALFVSYKLIRNAPRISSKLTGGLARTVSEITGKVSTESKKVLGISVSSGMRAHAASMEAVSSRVPPSAQPGIGRQAATTAKHHTQAKAVNAATKAGQAAVVAVGVPEAAPAIGAVGGLFEQRFKKKAQQQFES